jgi:hypothetical protein
MARVKRSRYAQGGQLLTPYQKILRASKRGTGVVLTADDVDRLMVDTAIRDRAELDEDDRDDEFDEPPAAPDRNRGRMAR